MAKGYKGVRLLMTGVSTAKKLPVVPVSAIAGKVDDEDEKGGPTADVADKHEQAVEQILFTNGLLCILADMIVGSPRPHSEGLAGWVGSRRRARRPVMMVLLPPCMLVTVASAL